MRKLVPGIRGKAEACASPCAHVEEPGLLHRLRVVLDLKWIICNEDILRLR